MTDAEALEVALRVACALITSALTLCSPSLRPHALAAITCFALYVTRVVGGPRVAVATYVVWPGVACALLADVLAHARILGPVRLQERLHLRRPSSGMGATTEDDQPLFDERHLAPFHAAILAPFALYAILLARFGAHLAQWWPWPLLIPNAAPVLLALATYRRPVTWAHRCAYALPCSAAADLATTWSGAPDAVRACVSAGTWLVFVGCCVGEARSGRVA